MILEIDIIIIVGVLYFWWLSVMDKRKFKEEREREEEEGEEGEEVYEPCLKKKKSYTSLPDLYGNGIDLENQIRPVKRLRFTSEPLIRTHIDTPCILSYNCDHCLKNVQLNLIDNLYSYHVYTLPAGKDDIICKLCYNKCLHKIIKKAY
jgi:hypothetical protein